MKCTGCSKEDEGFASCNHCGTAFLKHKDYKKHNVLKHPTEAPKKPSGEFFCIPCDKLMPSRHVCHKDIQEAADVHDVMMGMPGEVTYYDPRQQIPRLFEEARARANMEMREHELRFRPAHIIKPVLPSHARVPYQDNNGGSWVGLLWWWVKLSILFFMCLTMYRICSLYFKRVPPAVAVVSACSNTTYDNGNGICETVRSHASIQ